MHALKLLLSNSNTPALIFAALLLNNKMQASRKMRRQRLSSGIRADQNWKMRIVLTGYVAVQLAIERFQRPRVPLNRVTDKGAISIRQNDRGAASRNRPSTYSRTRFSRLHHVKMPARSKARIASATVLLAQLARSAIAS
jgi:hypothetical protein